MKQLFPLLLVLSILISGCGPAQTAETPTPMLSKKPKNIILLIGDGMGLSQVSAAQYYMDERPHFESFPFIGLSKTSSSSDLITDSAAGATAFSAGIKTYNGAIGVNQDTIAVQTITEQLADRGTKIGLVSTSSITHATPASFYAHQKSRRMTEAIAADLVDAPVDFFAGAGWKFFTQREDNRNLISEFEQANFIMDTLALPSLAALSATEKAGFLLAPYDMPRMNEGRGSFLSEATRLAAQFLSRNDSPFFLMVEGSQIDWGGHNNNADYLIGELLDFDQAIGEALAFAKADGNTLVIVTADHETGGFTLAADKGNYNKIAPSFSTGGHSATMVPVFAYGPGAEEFAGVYENTAIYDKMKALLWE
ncbi:alkaline phosphatase [Croceiramulus getboli]|nr:alkaline phosphatase [Flavobacteriaceae bacterium YJPT1-3]